ncbi:MAG: S-adenosylmethionine:tRNA ribosyltransferase-isomerase [Candidatus Omnitrophica bacterium]|nr:S-adenosylmethionine:tRNA ribosyltransferase-isomerase [Candidatus Omnitrophota bacterium]
MNDLNKYQTIYAKKEGAIAAPTAGFHFTTNLLEKIKDKGIKIVEITLHCGLSTFRPVKFEDIRQHKLEPEYIEVSVDATKIINEAKCTKKRIIAVGTTTVRALESLAFINNEGIANIRPFKGEINLYIFKGYKFKIIDSLITNFHTPYSTNLILVSAFCGYKLLMKAYNYAIKEGFRFYSFGDAMYIW